MTDKHGTIKSDASLRGKVRDIARHYGLRPQEVLQMYLFEHLLLRLEASRYADRFVLKGGLLISSMIGLANRTTMDMDTTVSSLSMDRKTIERALIEICAVNVHDNMSYSSERIEPIREDDEYANWRAHLRVRYGRMDAPIKVDITTGDIVTPGSITYDYPLMFEGGTLAVPAYPLETVLAEKFETCVRRGTANTRARDYYDLWALLHVHNGDINPVTLKASVLATAEKRGSATLILRFEEVLNEVRRSSAMYKVWSSYAENAPYAGHLSFNEAIDAAISIGRLALGGRQGASIASLDEMMQ